MNVVDTRPKPMPASPQIMQRTAPLVFIHAAPRTSSTWFWSKFRALPSTLCYYEPFNDKLVWLTPDRANTIAHDSWDSRHAPTEPYYREYRPLIQKTNGVELFDPAMAFQWFIPEGGLRGELRPREKDYLSLLIRHADKVGKIPVFGGWRSLGRAWAIKQAFGGLNIFQYRNLWQQWLSMVSYKRRGSLTFYVSVVDTICRDGEPYFSYLVDRGLKHAADPRTGKDPTASPLTWTRSYPNPSRDEAKVRQLELLPEHHTFALFMGLHIYLYLHAQISADVAADVTRMARDSRYRSDIERAIKRQTGLTVSFADSADVEPLNDVEVDKAAIDWDEIREHARVAVQMLSKFGDPVQLAANADALIDGTIEEMRKADAKPAVASVSAPTAKAAAKQAATGAKTIGLCMIVKNETKVIRRCLESVLPLVDYILVVDTGSTDGTQQMIRDFLTEHKVKGAVIDEPWRDFAYNRSVALARLRKVKSVDYAMIIDADDTLKLDAGFDPRAFKAQMTHDLYDVPVGHGNIAHYRPQLFSNRLPFSFKGVLHEYLEAPPGQLSRANVTGFSIQASTGGARSQNPRKYQDDAATLERALATETDPFLISRYTFYLAQSYRDCDEKEKALANYLKRAELGYWSEEIYVSLLEAGNLMAALDRLFDEVIAVWERATQTVPARAEALHAASHYCRDKDKNAEGMEFARRGLELKQPDGLFIQPWVYDYGILDEFSINAYWAGAYRESLDASLKLLAGDKLPPSMVKRIAANARFATDKMPASKPPNLGTLGAEDLVKQHTLVPQRSLRSHVKDSPRVMVAILAKQKEPALPLYLDCIEGLDYPKSSIVLYVRTNNNTDKTEEILRDWVARVGHLYHAVEFDASSVAERVEQYGEHEWNATRFSVLGRIRNQSMRRARELGCDFYFVADVDNFIRTATLRELVALDLPIAAPLLRSIVPEQFYSNYHAEIDASGYYKNCDQYHWILNRHVRGVIEVPVVHCTYLVRADVIPELTYEDQSGRHEYIVFSDSARKAGIPQYFDNRQVYGYITFGEGDEHHVSGGIEQARALLNVDLRTRPSIEDQTRNSKPLPASLDNKPRSSWPTTHAVRPKTLIFCTSFAKTRNEWDERYRRWLQAIRSSQLEYDSILIVDDGSPVLPDWTDIAIGTGEIDQTSPPEILLFHFQEHLGRKAVFDFPGWYRSFTFAGRYAHAHGFEKVIHIESDAFLIGSRVQRYFNDTVSGWTTLWCPRHGLPESAIQVIAGDSIQKFAQLHQSHPHEQLVGREFELQLPIDVIEKRFIGDRYGEYLAFVPGNAEYAVQVKDGQPDDYYWWLRESYRDARQRGCDAAVLTAAQPTATSDAVSDLAIHLINLDSSNDRLAAFQKRNAHLRDVIRFPAFDGRLLDRDELVKQGVLMPDCDYTSGALGCALSHLSLWKKATTENRIVTVFEDDTVATYRFQEKAAQLISTLPEDWDFIQWGYVFDPLFVWVDFGFSKANLRFYDQLFSGKGKSEFQSADFPPSAVRLAHSYGLQAYSVSPKGARSLLECCLPLRKRFISFPGTGIVDTDLGIDSVMSGAYGSMQAFICIPPLVLQDETFESDRNAVDRDE